MTTAMMTPVVLLVDGEGTDCPAFVVVALAVVAVVVVGMFYTRSTVSYVCVSSECCLRCLFMLSQPKREESLVRTRKANDVSTLLGWETLL
jgi:hypothetical protein